MEVVLADAGFSVRPVANAAEAMRALSSDPAIELLLTDIVMPGESGVELARRACALRPHLRVLFVTGYTRNIAPGALARAAVLDKPFARDRLLHAVDRVLREAPQPFGAD
jgi:DNA-binding NtrC family response regulator